jgi:protein-tyrosine phosphatase
VAGLLERQLTAILRSPPVMRVKHALRDAWWLVHGRSVAPPHLPARVPSVLFICKGNICRSPFAERLAAARLAGRPGGAVRLASAGYHATQAAQSPTHAVEVARGYGVGLGDHRPLPLSSALMDDHALVVVFEVEHLRRLERDYPEHRDRLVLLPLFAATRRTGYARYNIADPFGQPRERFVACYAAIDDALSPLLAEIARRQA